jgi:DNA-binding response OmpR family regulator
MQAFLYAANADERAVLQLVLQRVGLSSLIVRNLDQAADDWPTQPADLVVLAFRRDVPLAMTRQLRGFSIAPVILVSDPVSEDLQGDLYDAGADLIIFRPYSARILVHQIQALLRRSTGVPFFSLPSIARGDVNLDPSNRTVEIGEESSKQLTQLEFRLLYTLMTHPDQVFPAERLVEHIWGYSDRGDRDLVRGLIRRLRVKVEPDPKSPQYIITVPRVGYVFRFKS